MTIHAVRGRTNGVSCGIAVGAGHKLAVGYMAVGAEVPVGGREGARSEFSTYLHLIVCWLEVDAMVQIAGEKQALENLMKKNHYTWIYKKVFEDREQIGAILNKHNLIIHSVKR